eukprot:TRINITY_DN1661_c0_g1_i3.p1 TRINITY_DN1661_c0_g1~~TRINITY_DN1661_c0_g1_i3.p1  ORF type:complete len:123 (+),score=24.21 TRINITY_DN1661_c0_g1_i3:300-668(+)
MYLERATVFLSGPLAVPGRKGGEPITVPYAIRIATDLPRTTGKYTVHLSLVSLPEKDAGALKRYWQLYASDDVAAQQEAHFSVDRYFDEDGTLFPPTLEEDLRQLLAPMQELAAKKATKKNE